MFPFATNRFLFSDEESGCQSMERPMIIQQGPSYQNSIPELRVTPPDESNGKHTTDNKHPCYHDNDTKTQALVDWPNPFHMRPTNLRNFPTNQTTYRNTYRSQLVAVQRVRSGWISSGTKSLSLLRKTLQKSINKEIDAILQKYQEKFFMPAIENIKRNNGETSLDKDDISGIHRQILEDAKQMYIPLEAVVGPASPTGSHMADIDQPRPCYGRNPVTGRKRKFSDTDSESSPLWRKKKKTKGRPALHAFTGYSGRATPSKQVKELIRRHGPKWDSSRLTEETLFVMGARANKAVGFGQTRGRLYNKHPDLFKYCGDAKDKQWLFENDLMPASGGKAFLLLMDDIIDLGQLDEYRNNPMVHMNELRGFPVPSFMLDKMRTSMELTAAESRRLCNEVVDEAGPSRADSPSSSESQVKPTEESSGPGSPADDLDMVGSVQGPPSFMMSGGSLDGSPVQCLTSHLNDDDDELERSLSSQFDMD